MGLRIFAVGVLVTMSLGGGGVGGEGAGATHSASAADSAPDSASGASLGSWSWPIPAPHPLARAYLAPPTPYAAGHRGIDIRVAEGATVFAPDDGVVHFAGVVVDRPVLSLEHAGATLSSFEPVQTELLAGDRVARGQPIGTVLPGHCASPCLHLGARVGGDYVNPLLFLGGMPWSVLVPP